jgi:sulfur carrier protein
MTVRVNDRPHDVAGPATLFDLLRELALAERRGIAVALNGTVVPRTGWPSQPLAEADQILVIQATQGG